MTNDQLKAVHVSRRMLEKLSGGVFDRAAYDLVLLNLGNVKPDREGAVSSKALTQRGFERVMAFLEGRLAEFDPETSRHWRNVEERQGNYISTRQQWEALELYRQLREAGSPYELQGLLDNVTRSRVDHIDQLNPTEAYKLIEMLKAALGRALAREAK